MRNQRPLCFAGAVLDQIPLEVACTRPRGAPGIPVGPTKQIVFLELVAFRPPDETNRSGNQVGFLVVLRSAELVTSPFPPFYCVPDFPVFRCARAEKELCDDSGFAFSRWSCKDEGEPNDREP